MSLSYKTSPIQLVWVSKSILQKTWHQRQLPEIYLYVYYQELLRTCDKHISCTCVRKNVIEGLKNIGVETKLFGLHSLRVGGATAAANLGDSHRFF